MNGALWSVSLMLAALVAFLWVATRPGSSNSSRRRRSNRPCPGRFTLDSQTPPLALSLWAWRASLVPRPWAHLPRNGRRSQLCTSE